MGKVKVGHEKLNNNNNNNKKTPHTPNLLSCSEWEEHFLSPRPYAMLLTWGQRCLEERPECTNDSRRGKETRQGLRDSGGKIRSARAVWSQPGRVPSYENINACCPYMLPSPGMGTRQSQSCLHPAFLFGNFVHILTDFYWEPIICVNWLAFIPEEWF